ncbi:ABC-type transport auxiliary lipoprotein family protein [Aurantimonas sp. HBX-1]|uniref:ABC-type transport auxiliary lipoprotein family protein n=1 Tax=Aurantimonas sp. HBX-1 TaxID=2906072 RepID=UPI001F232901|nr:ABC-type transport auxiliary lipoprotein family protein [Aurantimonas sp. HBX-1]UIJ73501.1 ABC-type transport auxiliary lipoprotein family protein [Aurantimonas sp. HBX-1]
MKRSTSRSVLLAFLAVALSSCLSAPPPDTFEISAPAIVQNVAGTSRAQILIPEPTAIKTLDSEKIVVKPTPYSVEYLAGSQWSDRLPRMVQLRLLQAFENTGRIGAVGVPGQGLAIDYQMVMEVRKFEIDAVGPARAVIEISVKALNDRNGSVLRTKVFAVEVPVAGTTNTDYVAALDRAYEQISDEIVRWTLALI